MSLQGKSILVSGSARRLGKVIALALAKQGANIFVHHAHSPEAAEETAAEIRACGGEAWVIENDFSAVATSGELIDRAWSIRPLDGLVNSASIFEPLQWDTTSLADWQRNFDINLTAPFLLTQRFAQLGADEQRTGRVINIVDWRALRPGTDHFPYTIAKAGLAAMTQAYARALAPRITVNAIAFGAILPPSGTDEKSDKIIKNVPMQRWAELDEVEQTIQFLMQGPAFITGEIIHLDGGRHIV